MSALVRNITNESSNANNSQRGVSNTNLPITKPVYAPSTTTVVKDNPVMSNTITTVSEPSFAGTSTLGRWASNPPTGFQPSTTACTDGAKPQRFVTALPLKSSDSNNVALVAELLRAKRSKEKMNAANNEEKTRIMTDLQVSTEKENMTSSAVPLVSENSQRNLTHTISANRPVYRASGPNRNVGFSTYNPVPASLTASVPSDLTNGPNRIRPLYVDTNVNSSAGSTVASQVLSVGRLTIPKVVMGDEGQYSHYSHHSLLRSTQNVGVNNYQNDNRARPCTVKECNVNDGISSENNIIHNGVNSRVCVNVIERNLTMGENSDDINLCDASYYDVSKPHLLTATNSSGVYDGGYSNHQQPSHGYNDTMKIGQLMMDGSQPSWSAGSHLCAPSVSVSVGARGPSNIPVQDMYVSQQQYYSSNNINKIMSAKGGYYDDPMEDTHNKHDNHVEDGQSYETLPAADCQTASVAPEEAVRSNSTNVCQEHNSAPITTELTSPSKKLYTPQKNNKGSPRSNCKKRFNFAPVGKLFESPGGISLSCSPAKGSVLSPGSASKFSASNIPLSKGNKPIKLGSEKKSPKAVSRIILGDNQSDIIPQIAAALATGKMQPQKKSGAPATKPDINSKRKGRHDDRKPQSQPAATEESNTPVAKEKDILSFFASSPEILKSATIRSRNTKNATSPAGVADESSPSTITNTNANNDNQSVDCTEVETKHYVEIARHFNRKLHVLSFSKSFLREGAHVIFEGDRGEDIGRVVSFSATPPEACAANPKLLPTAMIIRNATDKEVELWKGPQLEEAKEAIDICTKCVKRHFLPLTVISAIFQFDRKKLTVYYKTSANRVDFRRLVMDLHNSFHCRIWMERIDSPHE